MIHIAICDDDTKTTAHIEKLIHALGEPMQQKLYISAFISGEEFCDFLEQSDEVFDIVLMDIEMGGITGVEAGRKLRENMENYQTLLIYISSHNNHHHEIINLNPFCFITKPIKDEDFYLNLTNAIKGVVQQRKTNAIPDFSFNKHGKQTLISVKSIMYLESDSRKIHLHTTKGNYEYYGKLNAEERKFPKELFCRIHSSYLVSFKHIENITAQTVRISGNILPISEKKRNSVKAAYRQYRGG